MKLTVSTIFFFYQAANANILLPNEDASMVVDKYCNDRLAELQELVDNGKVEEAVQLSHSFSREHDHVACTADKPFVGEGHFMSKVYSTHPMGDTRKHEVATHISMILPNTDVPSQLNWVPVVQSKSSKSRVLSQRSPVVGFSLNGEFILSESPIKCTSTPDATNGFVTCDAGHHIRDAVFENEQEAKDTLTLMLEEESKEHRRLSNSLIPVDADPDLIDATTAYALGTKKILAIMTCPSDSPSCGTQSYPYGYCYGKIKSDHGCASDGSGARSYATKVMQTSHAFYNGNSWGALSFQTTVTPPLKLPYKGGSCSSVQGLDYFSGKSSTALDVMAYAAAKSQGYDIADYDLNIIFTPRCPGIGWSGVGWVGAPGSLLYIYGFDHDASSSHELGHNFGANHASMMTGGAKGAKAWEDSGNTWSEYGNPLSVMGTGSAEARNDFTIQGKIIFDWLPVSQVFEVAPFTSGGSAMCNPSCGPYMIYPTDTTKSSSTKLALQISTSKSNRFYFLEHRTKSTGRSAVVITWSDISNAGRTGIYSNSVLADCTPGTNSFSDAGCLPGKTIVLDVGTASASRKIVVVVGAVDSSGAIRVEISNNLGFTGTTTPVAPPTVSPPTPTPPTTSSSAKSCDELGWENRYGVADICGTSSGSGLGRCSGAVTWNDADSFCKFAGGRLCTQDELQNNEARGTGCSYDSKLLWTSSPCSNGHMLAMGSNTFGSATSCSSNSVRTYTRCCADATVSSTVSTSSCADLGWPNTYGDASVCGASSGGGLGSCSGAMSWSSANSFCQSAGGRLCTADELQNNEARGTGCSYDSKLLWTSSPCSNGHMLAMGSNTFGTVTSCASDSSSNRVRCCADAVSQQGDVEAHLYSYSYSYDVFSFDVTESSYSFSHQSEPC